MAGRLVDVLRLDRYHGLAPGNKWFKLQANLAAARASRARTLASFGGPWSNHLHALAAIARDQGFASAGWIRGEADAPLTPMLEDAVRWGMALTFLSRGDYRRRHAPGFVASLAAELESPYVMPEGGANALGARGCADILGLLPGAGADYDAILLACGTGTTLAGLAAYYHGKAELVGLPVLKAEKFMAADIARLLAELGGSAARWRLDYRHHWGCYGAVPEALGQYIRHFERGHRLPLDPIYTAKLFYGVEQMIAAGEFAADANILLIHSGGLQGRRGYPQWFG